LQINQTDLKPKRESSKAILPTKTAASKSTISQIIKQFMPATATQLQQDEMCKCVNDATTELQNLLNQFKTACMNIRDGLSVGPPAKSTSTCQNPGFMESAPILIQNLIENPEQIAQIPEILQSSVPSSQMSDSADKLKDSLKKIFGLLKNINSETEDSNCQAEENEKNTAVGKSKKLDQINTLLESWKVKLLCKHKTINNQNCDKCSSIEVPNILNLATPNTASFSSTLDPCVPQSTLSNTASTFTTPFASDQSPPFSASILNSNLNPALTPISSPALTLSSTSVQSQIANQPTITASSSTTGQLPSLSTTQVSSLILTQPSPLTAPLISSSSSRLAVTSDPSLSSSLNVPPSNALNSGSTLPVNSAINSDLTLPSSSVLPSDFTPLSSSVLSSDLTQPPSSVLSSDLTQPPSSVLPSDLTPPSSSILPTDLTQVYTSNISPVSVPFLDSVHTPSIVEQPYTTSPISIPSSNTANNLGSNILSSNCAQLNNGYPNYASSLDTSPNDPNLQNNYPNPLSNSDSSSNLAHVNSNYPYYPDNLDPSGYSISSNYPNYSGYSGTTGMLPISPEINTGLSSNQPIQYSMYKTTSSTNMPIPSPTLQSDPTLSVHTSQLSQSGSISHQNMNPLITSTGNTKLENSQSKSHKVSKQDSLKEKIAWLLSLVDSKSFLNTSKSQVPVLPEPCLKPVTPPPPISEPCDPPIQEPYIPIQPEPQIPSTPDICTPTVPKPTSVPKTETCIPCIPYISEPLTSSIPEPASSSKPEPYLSTTLIPCITPTKIPPISEPYLPPSPDMNHPRTEIKLPCNLTTEEEHKKSLETGFSKKMSKLNKFLNPRRITRRSVGSKCITCQDPNARNYINGRNRARVQVVQINVPPTSQVCQTTSIISNPSVTSSLSTNPIGQITSVILPSTNSKITNSQKAALNPPYNNNNANSGIATSFSKLSTTQQNPAEPNSYQSYQSQSPNVNTSPQIVYSNIPDQNIYSVLPLQTGESSTYWQNRYLNMQNSNNPSKIEYFKTDAQDQSSITNWQNQYSTNIPTQSNTQQFPTSWQTRYPNTDWQIKNNNAASPNVNSEGESQPGYSQIYSQSPEINAHWKNENKNIPASNIYQKTPIQGETDNFRLPEQYHNVPSINGDLNVASKNENPSLPLQNVKVNTPLQSLNSNAAFEPQYININSYGVEFNDPSQSNPYNYLQNSNLNVPSQNPYMNTNLQNAGQSEYSNDISNNAISTTPSSQNEYTDAAWLNKNEQTSLQNSNPNSPSSITNSDVTLQNQNLSTPSKVETGQNKHPLMDNNNKPVLQNNNQNASLQVERPNSSSEIAPLADENSNTPIIRTNPTDPTQSANYNIQLEGVTPTIPSSHIDSQLPAQIENQSSPLSTEFSKTQLETRNMPPQSSNYKNPTESKNMNSLPQSTSNIPRQDESSKSLGYDGYSHGLLQSENPSILSQTRNINDHVQNQDLSNLSGNENLQTNSEDLNLRNPLQNANQISDHSNENPYIPTVPLKGEPVKPLISTSQSGYPNTPLQDRSPNSLNQTPYSNSNLQSGDSSIPNINSEVDISQSGNNNNAISKNPKPNDVKQNEYYNSALNNGYNTDHSQGYTSSNMNNHPDTLSQVIPNNPSQNGNLDVNLENKNLNNSLLTANTDISVQNKNLFSASPIELKNNNEAGYPKVSITEESSQLSLQNGNLKSSAAEGQSDVSLQNNNPNTNLNLPLQTSNLNVVDQSKDSNTSAQDINSNNPTQSVYQNVPIQNADNIVSSQTGYYNIPSQNANIDTTNQAGNYNNILQDQNKYISSQIRNSIPTIQNLDKNTYLQNQDGNSVLKNENPNTYLDGTIPNTSSQNIPSDGIDISIQDKNPLSIPQNSDATSSTGYLTPGIKIEQPYSATEVQSPGQSPTATTSLKINQNIGLPGLQNQLPIDSISSTASAVGDALTIISSLITPGVLNNISPMETIESAVADAISGASSLIKLDSRTNEFPLKSLGATASALADSLTEASSLIPTESFNQESSLEQIGNSAAKIIDILSGASSFLRPHSSQAMSHQENNNAVLPFADPANKANSFSNSYPQLSEWPMEQWSKQPTDSDYQNSLKTKYSMPSNEAYTKKLSIPPIPLQISGTVSNSLSQPIVNAPETVASTIAKSVASMANSAAIVANSVSSAIDQLATQNLQRTGSLSATYPVPSAPLLTQSTLPTTSSIHDSNSSPTLQNEILYRPQSQTSNQQDTQISLALPRDKISSAVNGGIIVPGDVITIALNNQATLVGKVIDSASPISFNVVKRNNRELLPLQGNNNWSISSNECKDKELQNILQQISTNIIVS
jgi:hypothetical protein